MEVFLLKQAVISILVTLNSNYLKRLVIMLTSLIQSNPGTRFAIYIAHSLLTEPDFAFINQYVDSLYCSINNVKIPSELLREAPITRNYPKEMYYRIFVAQFLPKELERVLYLDPDLLVINSLDKLYSINF